MLPSQSKLKQLLLYDSVTGFLYWKPRNSSDLLRQKFYDGWNKKYAGKRAFKATNKDGYFQGTILGKSELAHRVIFKMLHGTEPEHIDHANRIKSDNTEKNLLASDSHLNSQNSKKNTNNTSGHTGITWDNSRGCWIAQIKVMYKTIALGRFENFDDALTARLAAEHKHGFNLNHGK